MIVLPHTPIEEYEVGGHTVYVKREDLATPRPGPPFSKIRGLVPVLERLKKEGYHTIGYTETSVSMAGWGVAWACMELGLKCVIFDPQYKETPELLKYHRSKWLEFGAETIPLKAGMAKVNWHISKRFLSENFGKRSVLLPLGLPFPETIEGARKETEHTRRTNQVDFNTVVVNVGSGTVCAGVIKGFFDKMIIGVMGRTGNVIKKRNAILEKAGYDEGGLFFSPKFILIDPGWDYTERSDFGAPFPCHPWYDAKAWKWLAANIKTLDPPVLFWNIGALPDDWRNQ